MPAVPSAPIVVSDTYAIVATNLIDEADSDVSSVASAVDEEDVAAPAAPPTFTPITVRKNGGADLGPRGRLNLIEGTNVTLTVTDDAASGEVDVEIAASGGGGTHASSHENLGGDEIDVTGLSGELADPQPPKAHAADHAAAGGDPLDVTTLAGYPGGGTTFLRDDGTFAAPPGGSGASLTRIGGASGAAGPDLTWQALTSNSADITSVTPTVVMTTTGLGSGTWAFRYLLLYQTAATTTGIGFCVNHTGTTGNFGSMWTHITTGGAAATGVGDGVAATNAGQMAEGKSERVINTCSSASAGVDTQNATILAVMEGVVVVTASGQLELKMRTEIAGSAVRLMAGSCLELHKIA